MIFKIIRILLVLAFAIWLSTINANGHENERYKHLEEKFEMFGNGPANMGKRRIWSNKEHTMCQDFIFSHDKIHITEPFPCDEKLKKKSN